MAKQNKKLNQLLEKAKDSALLAISIYNDPKTSFRTSGFLVMICIAWTSLLHANFEKEKIKYYYEDKEKTTNKRIRYKKIDGENKAWELPACIKKIFPVESAIYKNLDFLYQLRNKIEHRFLPQIDCEVWGECQACVLNFEKFIISNFGEKHSIVGDFSVPLQMTSGLRVLPDLGKDKIITFIKSYRNSLSNILENDHLYSTKFYLMPKIGNHKNSSNYALEFVKMDDLSKEQKEDLKTFVIGIQNRKVEVEKTKYLPSEIVTNIINLGYKKFSMHQHTKLWQKEKAKDTNRNFGVKVANTWYWYQNWLDFVIEHCKQNLDISKLEPESKIFNNIL
jgi:hypothetical protein